MECCHYIDFCLALYIVDVGSLDYTGLDESQVIRLGNSLRCGRQVLSSGSGCICVSVFMRPYLCLFTVGIMCSVCGPAVWLPNFI